MPSRLKAFTATAGALLAAGALCASTASAAPVLYGATGVAEDDSLPASNLYTVDPATGATTSIGSIGKAITGLAVDNADGGKLYGVTAGVYLDGKERQLLRINPATGASTVVGSLGPNEIEDIAFNALGQLYGWNETGDDLYAINKGTGAITKTGESNLGVTYGDGLAFDKNGWLWAALDGDSGSLYTLNPATGAAAKGVRITGSPNSTGNLISSADFACDGSTLYGVVNDFGGAANLVTVDTATGKITNKGALPAGLDSIAWGGCPPPPQTDVGGSVPATLSLGLKGGSPVLGPFVPGLAAEYQASVDANVISTAADATLSVADASAVSPGKLVNGAFSLPQPLLAKATTVSAPAAAFAALSGTPLTLTTWSSPVSNDTATIAFKQAIGATDALRTGVYAKTLTFTLSTTTP
ncbi:DUF4394 domain-containing protein [Solirubrobacter phytolaccae]|uniref:DUF4394 domain-containing protein n=1 Tax=Solirubrobacter phytolaccae TaxID=1404360 RepID=A0A9X3N9E4_9ACTN|nr:hypothetical protein [Solirubrobacter phytolaccae]MDA0180056.1 DUF4394 domain-containing protein [Solirubrobacter phytolaccae]